MNLKEAGKLAKAEHVQRAIKLYCENGIEWLLNQTGRSPPLFRYTVVAGERVPTKAFGFLVAQLAGNTLNRSNDMTVNEAAAVLRRAGGVVDVIPGKRESSTQEAARLESYYRQLARPEQSRFRQRVKEIFGAVCAVSGCGVETTLEAAHIDPFATGGNSDVRNGILLRADIHRLFDANALAIEPATGKVWVRSHEDTHYADLTGRIVSLPTDGPSLEAFVDRWKSFDG